MRCDHCRQEFWNGRKRDKKGRPDLGDQIVQRGEASYREMVPYLNQGVLLFMPLPARDISKWFVARCHACGKTMLFTEKGSWLNTYQVERQQQALDDLYRALRHTGRDVDRDQEAEEDLENLQKKLRDGISLN